MTLRDVKIYLRVVINLGWRIITLYKVERLFQHVNDVMRSVANFCNVIGLV